MIHPRINHRNLLVGIAFAAGLGCANAAETPAATPEIAAKPIAAPEAAAKTADAPAPRAKDPAIEKMQQETERLSAENKLQMERTAQATAALRDEASRMRAERELLAERIAFDAAKRQSAAQQEIARIEQEKEQMLRDNELIKARTEKLANELKEAQTQIAFIETKDKRDQFAESDPVYLENPLKEDGTLVISDRRIALNGPITSATADYVTTRIDYWNNKNRQLPIFLVIDDSPGGSVMAGYRILKAMESSDAPVHVVVKSFAASMAATIATLAKESYAYPNAIILHHQISSQLSNSRMNLTQQREFVEDSNRWWQRLATPVAAKMGISTDEFIKRMYARSSSGDWMEFADKAKELKWVNHIVTGIDETSFTKNPDARASSTPTIAPAVPVVAPKTSAAEEGIDENGQPFQMLPRLNPKDVYFLYNPDGYYRLR